MNTYARIQLGIVVEIIPPYIRTEEERPPMPAPLNPYRPPMPVEPEGGSTPEHEEALQAWSDLPPSPTPAEQQAYDDAVALREACPAGPIPIEERFHPDIVETLVAIPEGVEVQQGYTYNDGVFAAPVPPVPTAEEVLRKRDVLLVLAATRIAPLQDAVDIGEATAEEEAALLAWKQYRVKLNRIQLQVGFPVEVQWPAEPV